MTVRYRIVPADPAAHVFEVTLTLDAPSPVGQRFALPAWIPGSYMIREFARNIITLTAHTVETDGRTRALRVEKTDKHTWQCAPSDKPIVLTYRVYAWDLSVRAAHLDLSHGFFNATSLCLLAEGHRDAPCELELVPPAHTSEWRVATSLPPVPLAVSDQNAPNRPWNGEFGLYFAESYDALIDHPIEMGSFTHATFEAHGITHHVALTGRHRCDMDRLCRDLRRICEAQISLFEPESHRAPFDEYWFLITAVGDGFGGLEHRASTALICSRDELPLAHENKVSAAYRRLLSLASHEYFHSWNVKRIKPERFMQYDLFNENYTRQLWFFEGITDYYDDLMLVRAGLLTPLEYLEVEAENIGRVYAQAGRLQQSIAESSFDAWVKYYRQDENAPNAIVSYYQKGAIIGLALDLTIREKSGGAKSLDDVMRVLWQEFALVGKGVPEDGVQRVVERVTGHPYAEFFADCVHGTKDPDLAALFAQVGVDLGWRLPAGKQANPYPAIGARITADSNGDARLAQVFSHGSAHVAGLSAGDVVIAVDGLRVSAANLERRIKSYRIGETIRVSYFRRDELSETSLTLQAQPPTTCVLTLRDNPQEATLRRRNWLGA